MKNIEENVVIEDTTNCADGVLEPLAPVDPQDPNRPAPFGFITENVYISQSLQDYKNRKKAKRMICDCQFDPEVDNIEEACGEGCLNRLLMMECGSRCPCGEYCTNKNFQKAEYADVEVFRTDKKGWGLKAIKDIPSDTFIMEYCGEVCTIEDFEQRKIDYSKENRRHYYFMSLRTDQILDATRKGNLSRFINHSCDPNCETQKWTVNGRLCIGFFSKRKIEEEEELNFDYKFQRFGDVAQKCYCGSANCRGYLGQTKQTSASLRVYDLHGAAEQGSPQSPSSSSRRRGRHRIQSDADSAFEKEVYDIVGSSWRLKETQQVIGMSRIMLQAETLSQRIMLLQVLQATEQTHCLKKFLSLQGLRLLWSWMVDSADLSSSEVMQFRIQVLQVLSHLPLVTKNQLEESKVLPVVTRWAEPADRGKSPVDATTPTTAGEEESEGIVVSEADSAPCEVGVVKEKALCDSGGVEGGVSEEGEEPIPTSEGVVDDVISCDSRGTEVGVAKTEPGDVDTEAMEHKSGGLVKEGVAGDVGCVTVKERACSSEAEARKTSTKEVTGEGCDKEGVVSPPPEEALQMQLEKLAQELLEKWAGLKEVFRIPKRAPAVRREVVEGPVTPPYSAEYEEQEEEQLFSYRRKGRSRGRRDHDHTPYHHQHRPRKTQSHSPSTLSPHTPTSSSSYFPSPSHSHQIHSSPLTASYTHHTPSSASSSPSPLTPSTYSHHHTPHQPLPSSPYQGGSGPVQSTVIVQQQSGQSLCVQQQIFRNGCQTTILPAQYITQQQTTPSSYVQLQQTRLPSLQPLPPSPVIADQVVYTHSLQTTPISLNPIANIAHTSLTTTSVQSLLGPIPGLTPNVTPSLLPTPISLISGGLPHSRITSAFTPSTLNSGLALASGVATTLAPLANSSLTPSITLGLNQAMPIHVPTEYVVARGMVPLIPSSHPVTYSNYQVQSSQSSSISSPLSLLPLPPPPPDETGKGLPTHWKAAQDNAGKVYYYHSITRKTQWTRPADQDEGTITMDLATPDHSSGDEDAGVPPSQQGPRTPVEDGKETIIWPRQPRTPDETPPPSPSCSTTPNSSPCDSAQGHSPHSSHYLDNVTPDEDHADSNVTPPVVDSSDSIPFQSHAQVEAGDTVSEDSPGPTHSPAPHTPPFSPPPLSPQETPPLSPSLDNDGTNSGDEAKQEGVPKTPPMTPPTKKRRRLHSKVRNKNKLHKEEFRHKLSKLVIACLDQHRKSECKYGRITCAKDFKYLARKLTYGLTEKEVGRKKEGNLEFTESVKTKVKEYIRQYMKNLGPVFNSLSSP